MRRDDVLSILANHQAELHETCAVKSLALFGSVARDEARPDSDVDVLVEFGRRPVGLFELADIQECLATILGTEVDLILRDSLKKHVRPNVEQDLIEIFNCSPTSQRSPKCSGGRPCPPSSHDSAPHDLALIGR